MLRTAILNSVVCLLGMAGGFFFAVGSIVSIANLKTRWSGVLLIAALMVPAMFLISGVGVWVARSQGWHSSITALIGLPWLWAVLFTTAMLIALKQ